MSVSPLTGPIAFSYPVHIADISNAMERAVRLSPRWKQDGLGAIEVSLGADFRALSEFTTEMGRELSPLMRQVSADGVQVWSVHIPFGTRLDLSNPDESERRRVVDYYKRVMDAAAEGGATVCVAHPSAEPIADGDRACHIEQCRKSIDELTAVDPGVLLAIECLPRTCLCSTSAETKQILSGTKARLCMDVNHPHHEPAADFIRENGDKLVTVHISDDDGLDEKHWMPGKGVIRFEDVLAALAEVGYTGPFLYELQNPNGPEYAGLDFTVNYNYLVERYQAAHKG